MINLESWLKLKKLYVGNTAKIGFNAKGHIKLCRIISRIGGIAEIFIHITPRYCRHILSLVTTLGDILLGHSKKGEIMNYPFSKKEWRVMPILGIFIYFVCLNYSIQAKALKELRFLIPLWAVEAAGGTATSLEPGNVAEWNNYLKDDDIVFIKGKPATIRLLKENKKGKRAVIRQAIEDIEKDIKFLKSEGIRFDYICYNPEDWPTSHTPEKEKRDVISAVKKVKEIAKKCGVKLIIITDTKNTLPIYGSEMAQHADIFVIQFQAFQFLPNNEFRKKVVEAVGIIKKSNPKIPVVAQISTNPPQKGIKGNGKNETPVTVEDMLSKISSIEDLIDGVGFLLVKEGNGIERFQEFLQKRQQTK